MKILNYRIDAVENGYILEECLKKGNFNFEYSKFVFHSFDEVLDWLENNGFVDEDEVEEQVREENSETAQEKQD